MRPLVVELANKRIEPGLLLEEVAFRGSGRLLLEREVHAFMPAVLLWTSWLDPLDVDAQAQPPDRQSREVVEAVGAGERHAIVGADAVGQSSFAKELLEGGDRRLFADRLQCFAQEQV